MRYAIPLAVLAALLVLLGAGLTRKPQEVPSPLIGKAAPAFSVPALGGGILDSAALRGGGPVIVNFWASWCAPCLQEHPLLVEMARARSLRIVGMSYKDAPADSERWLARHGSPYAAVGVDAQGHVGLDWGVYGVPETYVLDAQGVIRYKHIGPLDRAAWREHIEPLLAGSGT